MSINLSIKKLLLKFFPIFLLYILAFSTFSELTKIQDISIFAFDAQMILIYFYVLKSPEELGNGHIFLAGIINDIVSGMPLGVSSLSYLTLSFFTTYIRNATLRSRMTAEWFTFVPALFLSNLIYFIIINNFSHLSFYYVELLQNSFFTFLFFPIFYFFFSKIIKMGGANA